MYVRTRIGDSRSFFYEEHVRDAATPFFRRNIATRNGEKRREKTRGKTSRPTLCGAFLRVRARGYVSPTCEKETFKSRRMYATWQYGVAANKKDQCKRANERANERTNGECTIRSVPCPFLLSLFIRRDLRAAPPLCSSQCSSALFPEVRQLVARARSGLRLLQYPLARLGKLGLSVWKLRKNTAVRSFLFQDTRFRQ